MESIFTQDLLLQYVYGNLDATSTQIIEQELQNNPKLQQEVCELKEVVLALEKDDLIAPSAFSINHILHYSKETALEKSH